MAPLKRRGRQCWKCNQVGHFSTYCPRIRCWFCSFWNRDSNPEKVIRGHAEMKVDGQWPHATTITRDYYCWRLCSDSQTNTTLGKRASMVFSLLTQEGKLTCKVVIKGKVMRTLIDTGASVSLIRDHQYKILGLRRWLRKADIKVSQADGKTITIMGMVRLPVGIGGMNSVHKLYVTQDHWGEMILSKDWLR